MRKCTNIFWERSVFYGRIYDWHIVFFLILFWMFEFFFLATLTHRILYKDIKKSRESNKKKEFRNAVQNNNIWNIFNNKKVTISKKIFAWVLTFFIFRNNNRVFLSFI
ncbi:hypothetical protein MAQA_07528 [Listeria aquatica FSL S10-1188]|uniref:Uncharacterized protein n=1 Tax=Listeria aquatica FSL S10-1188 TaxID=1265818 RepID=W7AZA6_9LIST|nr:hypothetical protein MAQA_07528 [Listeria aquatica FSL S10-1188]